MSTQPLQKGDPELPASISKCPGLHLSFASYFCWRIPLHTISTDLFLTKWRTESKRRGAQGRSTKYYKDKIDMRNDKEANFMVSTCWENYKNCKDSHKSCPKFSPFFLQTWSSNPSISLIHKAPNLLIPFDSLTLKCFLHQTSNYILSSITDFQKLTPMFLTMLQVL